MAFRFRYFFKLIIICIFLIGCADSEKIAGTRVNVIDQLAVVESLVPIELPEMIKTNVWEGALESRPETLNYFFNGEPEKTWSLNLNIGRILGPPVIYDHKIIVFGERGLLKCWDLKTRELLWSYSISSNNGSKQTLIGGGLSYDLAGNLYGTSSNGDIFSVKIDSGALNWTFQIEAPIMGAPTVVENTIFVTDATNVSRSISSTGNLNWLVRGIPYNQIRAATGQPVPAGDVLLLPSSSGILSAVDKEIGSKQWDFKFKYNRSGFAQSTFGSFNGYPIVHEDKIYFGSVAGQFNALTLDGAVLWETNVGLQGIPLLLSNSIFFVSDTNKLIRLNKRTGSLIWATELGSKNDLQNYFSPVLIGSKIWITSSDGRLSSFGVLTGNKLDQIKVPSSIAGAPIYYSGNIILYTNSSELVAFE